MIRNPVALKFLITLVNILCAWMIQGQIVDIESFDKSEGWSFIRSDGVELELKTDEGLNGLSFRFDYTFIKGTGYGGIQKMIPLELPDNYEFSFYLKANSPSNNFEIKFIDSSGNNVWWVNHRNFSFPGEWKKIRIKKRHISFAWGPATDQQLRRIDRIEFTIASFVGGKGTIWIDDLKFTPLPPELTIYPIPEATASFSEHGHQASFVIDSSKETFWQSTEAGNQFLQFDFLGHREFGGLKILWQEEMAAGSFDVKTSDDGVIWETVASVKSNLSSISFIHLPEAEANFLRIELPENVLAQPVGIREVDFATIKDGATLNDFFLYTAKNSPLGDYPRYFLDQASYWTITGVNQDVKEALISEDGMVEVKKAGFSLEPLIGIGDSLISWNRVYASHSIGNECDKGEGLNFVPTVTWRTGSLELEVSLTAAGEANKNSYLNIKYSIINNYNDSLRLNLYLLIRPFQVNPHYQFLNLTGGVGKINAISRLDANRVMVDDQLLYSHQPFDHFGALLQEEGNPVDLIRNNRLPYNEIAEDPAGLANGVLQYNLTLAPKQKKNIHLLVPFHALPEGNNFPDEALMAKDSDGMLKFWQEKTGHIRFRLPASANGIINTYRTNLAYILINRDRAGIQPGSRSYERSWIRDGALTSSALLKSGIVQEVRDFIGWYADHQYENGKVPCVVDVRGPDPVPENDSHGQFIYLIREYFNFTRDTAFLRSKNTHVLEAVGYMESLIGERSTNYFKYGNDSIRSFYGLLPESISHEGYSARPMHSYWDDFFALKGLKDAAEIQKVLGDSVAYHRINGIREEFQQNLYRSIRLTMKNHHIDYLPGCAELGDFDATSTTIALTPCNELQNLPRPEVYNTFDRYYDFFRKRKEGKADWVNYTPYENRLIGSFILLDQPERAHDLIDFFLHDQRPQGWNHWAEVVWKEYRIPRYIGDMPHTWVGSDFINAVRSIFVYEDELDQSLVVASALYQDWIDAPGGMAVENLPTYYGEISYEIEKKGNQYHFKLTGNQVNLPENGVRIKNFNGSRKPLKVTVNGQEITGFTGKMIPVHTLPALVVIDYEK